MFTAGIRLHIKHICEDTELESLFDQWNQLAGDIPFRRYEWLVTWWRHYRQPNWKLFVIAAHDESGALIGVLPLYRSTSLLSGRVLRFLGSGEVCSDYLTLLAAESTHREVATCIGNWLVNEAKNQWDLIELIGLEVGDATIGLFAECLVLHGYDVHFRPGENCWRLRLPSTWDDFVASLSKSRRERVRKLRRRSFETGRVVNGTLEKQEDFDRYFRRLVELHQKRRNSLGESGSFASQNFLTFHRDVMQQMLANGLLRLLWTDLDGSPAAIEYALRGDDTIYFYQGGIEPLVSKEQPGWLSTIASIHASIEQGFKYYDFMRGDEAYKASWGAVVRPATELRVVAPRVAPRLRHLVWRTRKGLGQIRRAVKSGLSASLYRNDRAARRQFLVNHVANCRS